METDPCPRHDGSMACPNASDRYNPSSAQWSGPQFLHILIERGNSGEFPAGHSEAASGKRGAPIRTSAQQQRLAECLPALVPFRGQRPALPLRLRLRAVEHVLLPSRTHGLCALRILPCVRQCAGFAWRGRERRNGVRIASATAANRETERHQCRAGYAEAHPETTELDTAAQCDPPSGLIL